MTRKKLGELLLERKVVTHEQLGEALAFQRQYGHRLGAALVAKKFLTEQQLVKALGEALALDVVDLDADAPDWTAVHMLRGPFCESNELFPIAVGPGRAGRELTLAMSDPLNMPAIEEAEFTTGCKVKPVLATPSSIQGAIRRYYNRHKPQPGDESKMVLVRPGGGQEIIEDEPLDVIEEVEPLPEVTERTAVADLIREREQSRKNKGAARAKDGKTSLDDDLGFLTGSPYGSTEQRLEKLERKFWALMRILAKKGMITREEFLEQLDD